MSRYNSLPGYDAWKTRSPDEGYYEPEIVFIVYQYSPHNATRSTLGQYNVYKEAHAAGKAWLETQAKIDPYYASDYWYEVVETDLNEDCTCVGGPSKHCLKHGIDPDYARDQALDR